jgi:hypothetical protein
MQFVTGEFLSVTCINAAYRFMVKRAGLLQGD